MKKLSVLLLLAVAVCVAPAAYAQRLAGSGPKPIEKWSDQLKKKDDMQKFGNNIIRQIQKAKKAYEQQAKAKEQSKEFFKEAVEKIPFPTLADHESQPREQDTDRNPYFKGGDPHNDANYEKCRLCGEPITDENLHRKCPQDPDVMCLPAPKDASKDYTCYRCGKSFRPGQHCSAADYNAFPLPQINLSTRKRPIFTIGLFLLNKWVQRPFQKISNLAKLKIRKTRFTEDK